MASPDFWRDLATLFRQIPDAWTLSAEWDKDIGDTGLAPWAIRGATASVYSFGPLAKRGAREIASEDTTDLLAAWLDRLKNEGFGFKAMRFDIIKNPDGGEAEECVAGRIASLSEASANFCKLLESRALQSEFEERRRNRAGVRNLVHRQFEAIKQDVKFKSEQHKQIPDLSSALETVGSRGESVGEQLSRLREESRLTVEELAELVRLDPTNVYRHLANKSIPQLRKIGAYERVFSKRLKRKVVIKTTPVKRY